MNIFKHSGEYDKERQKILRSYFTDAIDILSESHSKNQIAQLFESLSFPLKDINNASKNLSFDDYLNLIDQINKAWNVPGLGLKLGIVKSIKNFGIYGYALMASTTYEQFNAVANRIFYAIYEPLTIENRVVGDMLEISYIPKTHIAQNIHVILMEQVITCGISLMSTQLPENVSWDSCIINCNYVAPGHAHFYRKYFPGTINFNQPVMQLCVPASWMQLPLKAGNNYIYSLCENKIADILSSLNTQSTLSNRVRHILLSSNFNNVPGINLIAKSFHMAERTLHLRLSREGTSYRVILNEVRNELAQRYLKESSLTVQEIAFLLGYEHTQNFYRAFLKNNRITPSQFRRGKQATLPAPSE